MQVFRYEAALADGREVIGEIAGDDELAVDAELTNRGLTVVDLHRQKTRRIAFGTARTRPADLIELTRALASLLGVGIPIIQILEDQETESDRKAMRDVIHDLKVRIEGGSSVSEALRAHPRVFGDLYVSMVEAGEESGALEHVLGKLAEHLEWSESVRRELERALGYPALVLSALAGFICLLTFFVFPRLGGLFTEMNVELPLPTRVLLAVGDLGAAGWPYALGVLAVVGIGGALALRRPQARAIRDRLVLRLPLLGRVVEMAAVSRFAHTLSVLLGAGVDLDRSLGLAQKAVVHDVFARAVGEARERVQGGEAFGDALERARHFPRLVIRLVRSGELSGDLDGMLSRLAAHYEREMPVLVGRVLSAIGPVTVFVLAFTVGFAALAIFLPMLRITTAISR